jgi:hypothetical protein
MTGSTGPAQKQNPPVLRNEGEALQAMKGSGRDRAGWFARVARYVAFAASVAEIVNLVRDMILK